MLIVTRSRARSALSLVLGIASVVLSYWMLGFFAVAAVIINLTNFTLFTGQSWRSFIFVITRPDQIVYVLGCLGLATAVGGLGLWLVRDGRRVSHPNSTEAAAVRFCLGGLFGAALDASVLIAFMAYRWLV